MNQRAFSAIELIGVLAILVILTALLLPRLSRTSNQQSAIATVNQAHIVEAVIALQSLEAAAAAHMAQFGSLASVNGAPLNFAETYDNFAQGLLTEGVLDKPFQLSLGTNSLVRLVKISNRSNSGGADIAGGVYDLHGDGSNNRTGAPFVLEAVIAGVDEADARALNDQLDGPRLGENANGDDLLGRVVYRKVGRDGRTEVHVYITQGR